MKTTSLFRAVVLALAIFTGISVQAQTTSTTSSTKTTMNTYLIQRAIPGAGKFTPAELKTISQTSCGVLDEMGPKIKWIHSYVVEDNIFCVYQAENEELLREHGKKGGFPVTKIMKIEETISPATAEL